MIMRTLIAGFVAATAFGSLASAQEVMKKEPPAGALRQGMYVFVDNGSCPKGQMLKVSAGAFSGGGRTAQGKAQARTKVCTAHP